jgi:cyanate permease
MRGSAEPRTRILARGVLVAALVFTTLYAGYAAVGLIATKDWTYDIPKSVAAAATVLAVAASLEMLVLGLNASFLMDRIVPRERRRLAHLVLALTALAAFGLAFYADANFGLALLSLVLPGAAAFAILMMFTPTFIARQEARTQERARRRASARGAGAKRASGSRPSSGTSRGSTPSGGKGRQRRGGRKRR